MSVIALLGFASGLPFVLSDSTLQAWMAVQGVNVVHVGLFSLVGLPYVLKFLWAPLLDRFQLGWLSRRRDWALLAQCALVCLLAYVGIADLASGSLAYITGPFPAETYQWHRLVPKTASATSGRISLAVPNRRSYVYLRAKQRNGHMAWTSPVFINWQ